MGCQFWVHPPPPGSTDRGVIETSLKTSFSRSHFSLFSPIPMHWANPTYSSGEKAWQGRDQPALQAKITGLITRKVGFFSFQFRIVLAVLPVLKERRLAIPLSASLKLSFWGSNPQIGDQIRPSVWINRLAKVAWYDLFRLFLQKLKTIYT